MYPAEILPLEYRSKGMGLAVACQWLWNFVMLEITPPGIANIGWRLYIIFAIFNAAFVPIVYFLAPETAGFGLEAVDLTFMDRDVGPIEKADELWKMMRKGEQLTLRHEMREEVVKTKAQPSQHVETEETTGL